MPATVDDDPLALVAELMTRARRVGEPEPTAHVLATAALGKPSARFLLMKSVDSTGLTFYTNHESRKARELDGDPRAAVAFAWPRLGTEVSAEGTTERVLPAECDAYFATRPRGSQLGAWASRQSTPLHWRPWLVVRWLAYAALFLGRRVPRPAHWGGYRLRPHTIEIVQHDASGLTERVVWRCEGGAWRRHAEVTWS